MGAFFYAQKLFFVILGLLSLLSALMTSFYASY